MISVIWEYFKAASVIFAILTVILHGLFIALTCYADIWLSEWSMDGFKNISEAVPVTTRLGVYGGTSLGSCEYQIKSNLIILIGTDGGHSG